MSPIQEQPTAESVQAALKKLSNQSLITARLRFFKTGPGEYGEGDQFVGVPVPPCRSIAKHHVNLSMHEINRLLDSPIHEERQVALFILVLRFASADETKGAEHESREEILQMYLSALKRGRVNNWDLIDASAEQILGKHLLNRSRQMLFDLSTSSSIWERRASIIATFAFIKQKDSSTTFELAQRLLEDEEPLIHKAIGWMLREIGKRIDRKQLLSFLDKYASQMPRIMLSYATEHLSPKQKLSYRNQKS